MPDYDAAICTTRASCGLMTGKLKVILPFKIFTVNLLTRMGAVKTASPVSGILLSVTVTLLTPLKFEVFPNPLTTRFTGTMQLKSSTVQLHPTLACPRRP